MPSFAPTSTRPISSLRSASFGAVAIIVETVIEARLRNPLKDIVSNPASQLVIAVEVNATAIG